MKLIVEKLSAAPSEHSFEVPAGWWEQRIGSRSGEDLRTDPMTFDIEARLQGEDVDLSGSLRGGLEAQCGRCLERYRQAIADTFRLVLEPKGDRTPADPETARALARDGVALGDGFETGYFTGPEIRLETFLAEVVSLAIPIQPLCREDCAGLCARCGCDLNQTSCDCEELKPESPFAALAALRGGSGEGRA